MKINFVLHLKTISTIIIPIVFIWALINVQWFRDSLIDVFVVVFGCWFVFGLYSLIYDIHKFGLEDLNNPRNHK